MILVMMRRQDLASTPCRAHLFRVLNNRKCLFRLLTGFSKRIVLNLLHLGWDLEYIIYRCQIQRTAHELNRWDSIQVFLDGVNLYH